MKPRELERRLRVVAQPNHRFRPGPRIAGIASVVAPEDRPALLGKLRRKRQIDADESVIDEPLRPASTVTPPPTTVSRVGSVDMMDTKVSTAAGTFKRELRSMSFSECSADKRETRIPPAPLWPESRFRE